MKLFDLILSVVYSHTMMVVIHARLDCDFDEDVCDWSILFTPELPYDLLSTKQICGFRGDITRCTKHAGIQDTRIWIIGNSTKIVSICVDFISSDELRHVDVNRLKHTLWKGGMYMDTTVVFTSNLFWFTEDIRFGDHWSTGFFMSNELSFSYHLSCLRYRYLLTGSASLVVSYLENFDDLYDDVPIKAHTTEGNREKFTTSSVNLPLLRRYKIIFRVMFNGKVFSTASFDSMLSMDEMCSDSCPNNEFICSSEECVNSGLLCDGTPDCMDGSDEHFCYDAIGNTICNISNNDYETENGTTLKGISNTTNSSKALQRFEKKYHSVNASCGIECMANNQGTLRKIDGTNFTYLENCTAEEIETKECDTGITNTSMCTPFCPSTCTCFGRSMNCVNTKCTNMSQVITLQNISCDFLNVAHFENRNILSLNIYDSTIKALCVCPMRKDTYIRLHHLKLKNSILHDIRISPSEDNSLSMRGVQLENCTITALIGNGRSNVPRFHVHARNDGQVHINTMTMTFPTENLRISGDLLGDKTSVSCRFNNMINLSHCAINYSPIFFRARILDLSHNFLTDHTYRSGNVQVLYIQHNLLSAMVKPLVTSLTVYDIIKVINMSYNLITELKQGDLFFRHLLYLNLRRNLINTIHLGAFSLTKKLVFLDLSGNKLSQISSGIFLPLELLQELYIQENNFQVFDGMFNGLNSLKLLQVEYFSICCAKPCTTIEFKCIAPVDRISSCENLINVPVLSVIIWYIALLATFGNFLVLLYNVYNFKNTCTKKYTLFTINLSLADFLMGIYLYIVAITNLIYTGRYGLSDYTWRHSVACTVSGIIATLSSEASALTVFLITLDRFIAVKYPFSRLKFSIKSAFILSVLVWVISLLLSLIPLFPLSMFNDFYAQSAICISLPLSVERRTGWEYSMIIFVGINFLLFLGILVGQISLFAEVVRSGASVRSSRSNEREKSLASTVFAIVLTDICCWIPVGTIGMLTFFGVAVSPDVYAWLIVVVLPINSALNPLLYTLTAVIKRMKKQDAEVHLQLKQQLDYWKAKYKQVSQQGDSSSLTVSE